MKNSLKIIVAAFSLIILLTAASFIYVKSVAEIEPALILGGEITRNYYPGKFNQVDVRRGYWYVEIIRSDSFFIQITGGDNLINNFLSVSIIDSSLTLDIDAAIKSENVEIVSVIGMPQIKELSIYNDSQYEVNNFNQNKLSIHTEAGELYLKDSQIEIVEINASGHAYVDTENSRFGTVNYSISDSAFVSVKEAEKTNCLRIDDIGVFANEKNVHEFEIVTSEKRKILTGQMKSYFQDLKWYMPFDTVIQIMERDSLNFRVPSDLEDYMPIFFSDGTIGYNNISEENPDIESVWLRFQRGLLTDITIVYWPDGDLESIFNRISNEFTEKYGRKTGDYIPNEFGSLSDEIKISFWKVPEENLENYYTGINVIGEFGNYRRLNLWYHSSFNSTFSRIVRGEYRNRPIYDIRTIPNIIESFSALFRVPG